MGLLKTLSNMMRSKKNELNEALKNPVRDTAIAIQDSEAELEGFQTKIRDLMARNKVVEGERNSKQEAYDKYDRIAVAAVEAGSDDDATSALEAQAAIETELNALSSEFDQNNALIKRLRDQLNQGRAKIRKAKSQQVSLKARQEGAKIREGLANAASTMASDSPLSALDDLEKAVNEAEARAEATEDLVGSEPENQAAALEDKYLSESSGVADRLAALKAKSGKKTGSKKKAAA